MPVGTRGAVRLLSSADLEDLGAEVILGNTYHLMLRPGADVVADLGGLHGFMAWDRHVLTDSGGYQIFSLEPKVDEDGATFRSTYDGSRHRLTPETAVQVQEDLGADIVMTLDICPGLPASEEVIRHATDQTARWAKRGRAEFQRRTDLRAGRGTEQAQFGISQGGIDARLRAASARQMVDIGFDGYAVGGLSVGEPRYQMLPALAAALTELPADQPRYLMGVGDPASLVEAVGLGIDMFDCVLPTRHARHGTVLTTAGRLNLSNAPLRPRRRSPRPPVRLSGVRPLVSRLPPAPPRCGRAHRSPTPHHPQPLLDPRPGHRDARRHRRAALRGSPIRDPRCLGMKRAG